MKLILNIFIICSTFLAISQEKINAQVLNSIAIDADTFIGFDGFDNCFYTKDNVLYKIVNSQIIEYKNLQLGNITKVDILNPLKLVVFYEDFNSVVLLDNQLNEIQKINFSEIKKPITVSAVGISGQNKLWIYNVTNQQIALFDLSLNEIQNLNIPIKEKLQFYQTDFNYFYWIDNENLIQICTVFGEISQKEQVESFESLQMINENILLYKKDNCIYIYNFTTKNKYKILNVEKSFKKMFYKDQILSIFTDHEIINYKITLP